jgi:4-oxalocrotonate tautomerase
MSTVPDAAAQAATEAAIRALLQDYFDGLHISDATRLGRVFHPSAMYACASSGTLQLLDMAAYLAMVAQRPSPASLGQARRDEVVSIEMAGPVTALARVHCTIAPKRFTDLLTLVQLDGRWQILAKVFHFDLVVP